MKLRDDAKKEAKLSGLESDFAVYRKLRNRVVSEVRKAKTCFYREKLDSCSGNPKQTWNTINSLLGRRHTVSPACVLTNEKLLSKPRDIAEHFAGFYEDKVTTLRSSMDQANDVPVYPGHTQRLRIGLTEQFTFQTVSGKDVHKVLSRLPDGKAPGKDDLDNKLLKMSAGAVAEPIAYIINLSFKTAKFPTRWKHAKVVPIPKDTSKPLSGTNSRPVSLLPACGKVCEILASEQIVSYLSQSGLQSEAQHAYRKYHDEWLHSMDNGMMTAVVLLDYSAAFDLVDHGRLLNKLSSCGFSEETVGWVQSYLSN
ncbi:Hypp9765 [Branchiostoma lanceolatum]|uniref:Hypp9765 protein n=1 Tax=Branchiostoma lanceolatum TaxID=7740 RepID=A0A8S4MPX3_BRALA|nr:Hypp9765 [Branchiostoma lanceolatum]